MKKFLAVLLAVSIVISMSSFAFAAEDSEKMAQPFDTVVEYNPGISTYGTNSISAHTIKQGVTMSYGPWSTPKNATVSMVFKIKTDEDNVRAGVTYGGNSYECPITKTWEISGYSYKISVIIPKATSLKFYIFNGSVSDVKITGGTITI